jgi:phage shock protein A
MKWIERIALTLKAEGHGAIDAVEDKSLLLRQCVREAELELARKRAKLNALEAECKALETEATRLNARNKDLEEDIELALDNEKQDLARHAIKQVLPIRARQKEIALRQQLLRDERRELDQIVGAQTADFDVMKARAQAELSRTEGDALPLAVATSEEDIELELLRRQQAYATGKGVE